ncbi:hypothetical protein EV401DRAFT_2207819 [Pisolithus croceorrhizus]|nr:hypothetical protein EV401DRAFT_2207819 [Pisolithus croceorrhizus]
MAPGLRFQHPPPSSDGAMIVPPVPVGVHTAATRPSTPLANSDFPSGNVEGVRNAANREITRTYSPPSPASNANIPAPTPIQGFLSRGTAGLTPALTEVRLHSLEGDAGIPAVAHAEGTHSTPPSSRPTYRLDPAKVQQQIDRISRFRVLIMGRANAGKTTILQRVCNSTDQPEIVDGEGKKLDLTVVQGSMTRGYHNIESGLIFRSTPGFVFHDSCGFEAGSEEQFNIVMEFVRDRAKATKLDNRIHAIWFCIPLSDTHKVLNAEKRFFDKVDTGHVPVILLATKADTLELEVFEQAEDQGLSADDAEIAKLEKEILNNHMENLKDQLGRTRFPPHDYLSLSGMQVEGADCTPLLRCTADVLEEDGLQQLLISTLQSNLGVCIEYAIMKTLRRHMKEHGHEIVPKSLAMDLAMWFPYNVCGIVKVGNVLMLMQL